MAAALTAAGYTSDVYDFDARAARPRTTSACCRTTRRWCGRPATTSSCGRPGRSAGTTTKAALDIELSVRDYLNEGGKLLVSGKYALFAQAANGAYFYNPFAGRRSARRRTTIRACRC